MNKLLAWVQLVQHHIRVCLVTGCKRHYLEVPTHPLQKCDSVRSDSNVGLDDFPALHHNWQDDIVGTRGILLTVDNRFININYQSLLAHVSLVPNKIDPPLLYVAEGRGFNLEAVAQNLQRNL